MSEGSAVGVAESIVFNIKERPPVEIYTIPLPARHLLPITSPSTSANQALRLGDASVIKRAYITMRVSKKSPHYSMYSHTGARLKDESKRVNLLLGFRHAIISD